MRTFTSRQGQEPLTLDAIREKAPSAFAPTAYADRSDRYTYIPTANIIEGMQSAGFQAFWATQSKCRDLAKREFTKHMIRFRHADTSRGLAVGDSFPEVVLVNSHDGTSAYKLMAGIFRLVCGNGMIVSEALQGSIKVRHTGNIIDMVINASNEIVMNAPKSLERVRTWKALQLNTGEQSAFAEAAHTVRFADADGKVETPITAEQLLRPRRYEDKASSDLYTTLNVVQENVIRGGLRARGTVGANGRRRMVSTRAINGIDQDVKLNQALWKLAERMAELKAS